MIKILLKQFSIVFLLLVFLLPQNILAQSNVEQIIKRYEMGELTNYTSAEKQIISEYLDGIQKPNNITKERVMSPDATTFFEEDFSPPILWNDNFDYSGLLTDNGWTAHSGAGTNAISTTTGLTYTGYPGSGVGNAAQLDNTGEDVNQSFTAQTSGNLYISALVNVTSGPSGYFMHIAPHGTFNYVSRLWVKPSSTAGKINFGISNSSSAVYATTPTDYDDSTTYLAIIKYSIGTPDSVSLWIVSSGIPADEGAAGTPEVTDVGAGQSSISGIYLRQYNSSQDITVDGIRIGTSWSEILFPVAGLPSGWTNVDNGTSGFVWAFDNPGGRTITGNFDSDFTIIDSDDAGSGVTLNATLTTPAINCATATNVSLGFDNQFNNISSDYGIVEISNDGSTWTQVDSISSDVGYPNPPVYSEYDVTSVAAGQSTVYVRWTYNDTGSWAWWWAIDNVIVYEPDAQPLPAIVVSPPDAATDIALDATLNWVAGGGAAPTGYKINFGTDNPPTNIENNTDLGDTTMYTPSSLSYSTTYYWEIIPYNGAGDATGTSIWSFTTMDDPTISTFPWLEAFEGTFPPLNWNRYSGLLADTTVLVTGSQWFQDDWLNVTATHKSARINIYGTTRKGWLMTPPIDLGTGTNYQLEFDLALTDYANSNPPDDSSGVDDKFAVVISTDGGSNWYSANTLKLWDSTTTGGNYYYDISYTGQHEIIDLTAYSGVIMLGFYGESTISNGDNDLFVDNVKVQEVPVAPIFTITPTSKDYGDQQIGESSPDQTFTISNTGVGTLTITSGSISIVGTDASQFVLTDGNTYPINLTTGQTATVDVNFSPTTVGAKTADLQIVDNTADATHLVPLTGTGVDATVSTFPYTQAFENGGSIPTGWTQDPANTEDWFFGTTITYAASSDHTTGTGYMALIDDSSPYNANPASLLSPPLDISGLTTPTASFFYWIGVGNAGTSNIVVDVFNGTTWQDSVITALTENGAWSEVAVDLTSYKSTNTKVRFRGFEDLGNYQTDISLDDFSVFDNLVPPNCALNVSPADLEDSVSVFTNLDWASGGGGPTGYLLYFGTDNPPTNIENGTDLGDVTTYDPATNLSYATTFYWQVVPYNGNGNATGCAIWSFTTRDDPTITTFPWTDDLENPGAPGTPLDWTQDTGDDFDWTFDAGGTPSSATGPSVDHNPGTSAGTYGFTESSTNYGNTANIWTPPFDVSGLTNPTFSFWYHMYGATMGTLSVDYSTDNGTTWTNGWTLSGDQGDIWYSASFTLPTDADYVRFSGLTGTSYTSDMAFDDVSIFDNIYPVFELSPTSHDFGTTFVGTPTPDQTFTISNTGVGTITINSGGISLIGADASEFVLTDANTYPINLGAGASVTVDVNLSPTTTGNKTADLQIVASTGTYTAPLTGNALPAGILFEDFTDPNALARWTVVNLDSGAYSWLRYTTKFRSAPASAGSHYESSSLQNNDWLISPKLVISSGDSLTFWHSIFSVSFPESLYVMIGTTNDPTTGVWDTLDVILDNTLDWDYESYDLTPYAGSKEYVAFVNRSLDEFYVYVDDIIGPQVYVPAVDLAFTDFYQSTGLPVPRPGERFTNYNVTMNDELMLDGKKLIDALPTNGEQVHSTIVERLNPISYDGMIPFSPDLVNVDIKGVIKNLGLNAASYDLNWTVGGISQPTYNGPSVVTAGSDTANLTYTPADLGTYVTTGDITVAADENPGNDNATPFRMRVYPDTFTRTLYDRGDNVVDTYIGWGDGTLRMKAGVRFTAPGTDIKLAGVDYICRTETVTGGTWEIQVRDTSSTPDAPGAVLYEIIYYDTLNYYSGAGDYIYFPFDDTAPVIPAGEEYWITIKAPLGILYPGAAHNTGFTPGHSYYEGTDTTTWSPLVITTERAWIMRSVEVAGANTFQLTVGVSDGWNMVSVPGTNPAGMGVTDWWAGLTGSVFKFSGGYQVVTTATPGEGYWMKHAGAQTYNTGDEWPASGIIIVPNDPISAAAGWNMIGVYENTVPTAGLTTTPPGLISGQVFGYSGGYVSVSNLLPGYGFWIKLTGAGVINMPPGPLSKGSAEVVEYFKDDWGRITITDNAGRSYTLYAVNGEVNLDDYELPPMPPEGMFDIRFGSGRIAEDINSSIQSIDMSGIEYPVTVRVENMDIRLQDESGKEINENVKSGEQITINNKQINKLMVTGELIPDVYALEQNYPNPFNPSTVIEFSLPEDVNNVALTIYDILGQRVTQLVNGSLKAGKYQYQWNAGTVATGMYIYELRTDKFVSVKKMMLLK